MPEERGMIIGDRVETRLDKLSEDVTDLKVSVGRLESGFSQMDKRLSNVEAAIGGLRQEVRQEIGDLRKDNRQSFNWMLGMWITTILAILTMSLTILSKMH